MKINTEVLTDYLNEQCDELTRKNIEKWINDSPKNKSYFDELQFYWDRESSVSKHIEFDPEKGFKQLKKKKAAQKRIQLRKLMQYAAVIALVISTSITSFVVLFPESDQIVVENHNQSEKMLNLPDGTSILLAQGGFISYSENFSETERLIKLKGEAFFDVAKDKNRPFIITTSHTKTRVLGTSFRITEMNKQTAIKVQSGIVEFIDKDDPNNKLKLTKGESARFFENQHALISKTKGSTNSNLKIKHLAYQNEKLETICQDLNEFFNTDIRIGSEQKKQLSMTATFEDQDLNNILESISFSLNLDIEKKDKYILLK